MAFNPNDFNKDFDKLFGAGSFESGLNSARNAGRLKVQSQFAKQDYNRRLKETQKAAKKAAEKKTYDDAVDYWNDPANREHLLGRGPKKVEDDILNDPRAKATIKELGFKQSDFVDAMYNAASSGEQLSKRGYKQDQKKEKDTVQNSTWDNPVSLIPMGSKKKSSKKKKDESFFSKVKDIFDGNDDKKKQKLLPQVKKKESKSLGDDLKAAGKSVWQGLNPFDDVSATEAVTNFWERNNSKTMDQISRGANRAVDSASFGIMSNLDKKMTGQTPSYLSKRKFGEGGGTDMLTSGLGYLVPGAGAYKGLNALKPGKALTQLGTKGLLPRLGSEAAKGAIVGAGLSGAEVGVREGLNPNDYNWKQNLGYVGLGTAAGAIADPLLYGAGKGIQNGLSRFAKGEVPTFTGRPSQGVVDSLTPNPTRSLQNSNGLYDDLILNAKRPSESTVPNEMTDEELLLSQLFRSQNEPVRPPETSPQAPTTRRNYEPITAGTEKEPPLARVANQLLDTQRQASGDINSFRSRVNRTPVKKDNDLLKNLRTQFIDDVAPLETLEKNIAGKVDSAENSLYKQARLFKGSPEKAHLVVQEQLSPILKDLQDHGLSYKDLGDYALAVHAKDVNAKGINSGFTNAEIDDVIRNLGTPKMEAARQKLLGVNNHVLDTLKEGGILNDAQVAGMREKWPNYVSLFRAFDDDKVDFASGVSKAMANASSPIKKLEGSNRDVIDPMESVVKNIFKATNTADRNAVASQIGKLAEKDTEGNFIRKLADKEDAGRLNVISVMDNGKKVKYEVPPEVYKTMMNLDKESTNTLVKILQKPASLLRAGATLTPEFSLRNPMRDVPNAFVVSESGFNPLVDFPVGLWQSIWKGRTIKIGNKEFKTAGDLYKEFVKENGGYGNIISMDRKLHQQTLKKALTEVNANYVDVLDPKAYKSLLSRYKNPMNALRKIADVSETATKVGEFRAAKRSGASPQEAAYRARDIMDFGRSGTSIREANKVVAFLNANIQGKSKLFRSFKQNPTKFIGKAVAIVTLPTIAEKVAQNTYANEKQQAIIDDAPKWLKNTFWLFPIPGTNQIARIPKPFDLAFPFANTFSRAFDFVNKHDKDAFNGFIKEGFSQASIPVMLTGIAPVIEGMANYSFFRQGPIIPKREEGIQYPDQYDINTSEVAKGVGKGVNKITGGQGAFKNFGSPRVIDNTIQGFTGGTGAYASNFIDWFLNSTGAVDNPEKPTKSIDQKPLARAFLVNQSGSGQSLDDLYTMKDKLTDQRGSAKQNNTPFTQEGQYKFTNGVTKDISKISGQIRTIENASTLSGEQKKKMIDELIKARNNMARQAMERLRNQE